MITAPFLMKISIYFSESPQQYGHAKNKATHLDYYIK